MNDQDLMRTLQAIVGADGVLSRQETAQRSAGFMRADMLQARLLVKPRNTEQVAAVLTFCHAARLPVVTHGGLTGLVHGGDATAEDIILSLERMNAIECVDARQRVAVVQAGVTLQALQEAAEAQELFFPLDLGARGSCTVGGNVATNAGGNRVIRYGMTRALVLGLEAVLADGRVVASLNQMIKNNAGYDLKQLFIGSEGTLGVITRVVLRLFEKPKSQDVALVAVDSFAALGAFLKHIDAALGGGLSAFEAMWREFYQLVTTAPAKSQRPLPDSHPYYVLVEAQGADAEKDAQRFHAALESALEQGLIADAAIAHSARERAAIWALRDDVMQIGREGPPITFDVSLPIAAMEAYLAEVRAALAAWPEHRCWIWGHLGDGNLHIAILADAARALIERIVYEPLQKIGGSVSAEHGVGLEKKPYLALCRDPGELELMRALKRSLDPCCILNPGKIFAS